MTGVVTAEDDAWEIGTFTFSTSQLGAVTPQDWDQDGVQEPVEDELRGVVDEKLTATVTYDDKPVTITAFETC